MVLAFTKFNHPNLTNLDQNITAQKKVNEHLEWGKGKTKFTWLDWTKLISGSIVIPIFIALLIFSLCQLKKYLILYWQFVTFQKKNQHKPLTA